ncbi:hypothetical protein NKDENANG_01736 [Candidatus Entotheonellaceae bacterium PAL068K]
MPQVRNTLFLLLIVLSACAPHSPGPRIGPAPTTMRGAQLHGSLFDVRARRFIAFETLVTAVSHVQVVALGEEHYHPGIQAFELHLLQALAQRRPRFLALGMEFLERDAQPALDVYLPGTIDPAALQKRLKVSPAFMQHYFPLIRYAQQVRAPILAMNLPRRIARRVAQHGLQTALDRLSPTDRTYMPTALAAITHRYRTYFLEAVATAHSLQGEQAERFVAASHLKDATMAAVLAEFLEQHPHATVLAIAGRFHFDYGLAIPALLQQRRPDIRMRRITTMAVPADNTVNLHRLAEEGIADYICFFPPSPTVGSGRAQSAHRVHPLTGHACTRAWDGCLCAAVHARPATGQRCTIRASGEAKTDMTASKTP